jgi:ankyrin repeat protein
MYILEAVLLLLLAYTGLCFWQQMPGPAAAAPQVVKQGSLTNEEALRQAASSGDVAQVHELLASAASPDAADVEGWTALHWACGQADVATVLLDAGASVDARDRHGKTTLHW